MNANRLLAVGSMLLLPAFSPALAQTTPGVPGVTMPAGRVIAYTCDNGQKLSARYVNAGKNSLAMLPVDGSTLVFVAVMSGSGARYASGFYIWWTKGSEASLYDERKGADAAPLMTCTSKG